MSSISNHCIQLGNGITEHFSAIGRVYENHPVKASILTISIVSGVALLGISLCFGSLSYLNLIIIDIDLILNFLTIGTGIIILSALGAHYLIKSSAYMNYIDSRNGFDIDSEKPILLVLFAKSIRNDLIHILDQRERFKQLESHYQVVFKYIQSPDEMKEELKEFTEKKISLLWFQAHGSAYQMEFGSSDEECLTVNNLQNYSLCIKDSLTEDAQVVLESCEVGGPPSIEALFHYNYVKKEKLNYPNLATAFYTLISQSIYCPTTDINYLSIVLKNVQPLDIEFYYRRGQEDSCLAKIANLFHFCLYAYSPSFLRYRFCAKNVDWSPPSQPILESEDNQSL